MSRPLIGITVHTRAQHGEALAFELAASSAHAIYEAGGLPFVLPTLLEAIPSLLDRLHGIVLTGGGRLVPGFAGKVPPPTLEVINPSRYAFERALILQALSHRLPMLGICRGMQMLNETFGGRLIGSIAAEVPNASVHYQRAPGWRTIHELHIDPGTHLAEIAGSAQTRVNSFHRQAVRTPGQRLRVVARAPDGVIEALEALDSDFLLGVQFHPERMMAHDRKWLRVFEAFVAAAQHR